MKRKGFTLLESIIVIAILGVISALLLSAVQRVRATALKSSCANNLRQIGLAFQSYHASHQRLPSGVRLETDSLPFMGWQGPLLPYLDQAPLWEEIKSAATNGSSWIRNDFPPRTSPVPTYACAADPFAGRRHDNVDVFGGSAVYHSYLGVAGWSLAKQLLAEEVPPKGVLYFNSNIRFSEITDGLSQTLIAGEKPVSSPFVRTPGKWYVAPEPGHAVMGVAEEVYLGVATAPCTLPIVYQPPNGLACDDFHFWSYHPNGSNFLFVDGSVRFFTYASAPIMLAIASRNDQESVDISE